MKQKVALGDFKVKTGETVSRVEKSIETTDDENTSFTPATPTRNGRKGHMTDSPRQMQTSPRLVAKDVNEVINIQHSPTKSPPVNNTTKHYACSLRPTNPESSAFVADLEKSPEKHNISNGIVLQSAIRKHASNFSTRHCQRQELGAASNANWKRVTFAEEPPQALSPPKWYMDALEAAKLGNHKEMASRKREAHDIVASDNVVEASQVLASRRQDMGDTLRRDRSDSALEALPRWR